MFAAFEQLEDRILLSSNQPPIATPGHIYGVERTTLLVSLQGSDADGDPLTATVTSLPVSGALYQTIDGVTPGAEITSASTPVADSQMRVIFVPDENGPGAYETSFGFTVNDGLVDSAEAFISLRSAADTSRNFYVTASSPNAELENLNVTPAVAEGGMATLTGDIVNPVPGEEITLTVDWGDNSPLETFTYASGTSWFSETHQYQDENPLRKTPTVEEILGNENDSFTHIGEEFLVAPGETWQERPRFHQVATDSEGNSVVVWHLNEQRDGSSSYVYNLYGQRFDPTGQPLGEHFRINSYIDSGSKPQFSLTMDNEGNFIVAWVAFYDYADLPNLGENRFHVRAQRFDSNGNRVGDEFRVNREPVPAPAYINNGVISTSAAIDNAGNFVILWSYNLSVENETHLRTVKGQRFDSEGNPLGDEFQVNTHTSDVDSLFDDSESQRSAGADTTSVMMDSEGNFVVIWADLAWRNLDSSSQTLSRSRGIFGQRYHATGEAVGEAFLFSEDPPYRLAAAMNPDGNYVVTWIVSTGGTTEVRGRLFTDDDQSIGETFSVATERYLYHNVVAMDDLGNFVVSWDKEYPVVGRGYFDGVMAQRYDANGTALGRSFLINPVNPDDGQRHPDDPAFAMDSDGNLLVVYRKDAPPYSVFGQWYQPNDASQIQVQVHNVAPKIEPLWLSSDQIDENGSVAVEVSFTDPGPDVHSIALDWGDGQAERVDLPFDGRTFTLTHQYPDDGLTTPASRQYTITATVIENNLLEVSSSATLTVNNIVPETDEDPSEEWPANNGSTASDPQATATRTFLVTILESNVELQNISVTSAIDEGDTATLTAEIIDAELGEDISITVDWGDNSPAETFAFTYAASTESLSASHQYKNNDARLQSLAEYTASDSHHVGTPFTPTGTLTQENYSHARHGVIADQWGTTTAFWTQGDHIYARRYDQNHEPLGEPFRVSTYPTDHNNSYKEVVAAVDAQGNVMIVWAVSRWNYDRVRTSASASDTLHAQRYDRNGQPLGSEFQLVAAPGLFKAVKALAMDVEGNFAIIWEANGYFPVKTQLSFQRFDVNGHPLHDSVPLRALGTDQEADIAIDADGNAVVVWNNGSPWSNAVAGDIYAARFDSQGRQIGDDFLIRASDAGIERLFEPEITMDADGNFIVAWAQDTSTFEPTRYDLYARRYDSTGAALGNPFRINPLYDDSSYVYDYDIVIDNDGSFIASWQGRPALTDGFTQSRIFLQRFDADGRMIGRTLNATQRLRTLTGKSPHHQYPSVVIDVEGNVDVWFSDGQNFTSLSWAPSEVTTYEVEVENVAPTINPLVLSADSINENGTVTLNGSFFDPGIGDRHSVTIDWGDGTIETIPQPAGSKLFSLSHQYLDNPMVGGSSEQYQIIVSITDLQSAPVTATTNVTVENVAPQIQQVISSSTGSSQAGENESVTVRGKFTDVGTLDTHTVTIDWGDGNVTSLPGEQIVWNPSSGIYEFAGEHAYPAGGSFPVTVTVTDDDQGQATETVTTLIKGVGLHDGTLYVIDGYYNESTTEVSAVVVDGVEKLRVTADFLTGEDYRDFNIADVVGIEMILGHGNDTVTIAGDVLIPAVVNAGQGDDHIVGGGGNDSINGGLGEDTLEGGPGNDTFVSPAQNDTYVFSGNDLGEDIIEAGWGTHTLDFTGMNYGVTIDLNTGELQTVNADLRLRLDLDESKRTTSFLGFENYVVIGKVLGTDYDDVIRGNRWANQSHTLHGRGGKDTLIARGNETLDGGAMIDTYVFSQVSNNFTAHYNTILAGEGDDVLDFRGVESGITIDLASTERQNYSKNLYLTLQDAVDIADVHGTDHDDVILGNSLPNRLYGYGGADILAGRFHVDVLSAGDDQDIDAVISPDHGDVHLDFTDDDYVFTKWVQDITGNSFARTAGGTYLRKPLDDTPWDDNFPTWLEIPWFDTTPDGTVYWLDGAKLKRGETVAYTGVKRAAIDSEGALYRSDSQSAKRLSAEGSWQTIDEFRQGPDGSVYWLDDAVLYRNTEVLSDAKVTSLFESDGTIVARNADKRITFVARGEKMYRVVFIVSDSHAGINLQTKEVGESSWISRSNSLTGLAIEGDRLFFLSDPPSGDSQDLGMRLWSLNLDTNATSLLATDVLAMSLANGNIYYLREQDGRIDYRPIRGGIASTYPPAPGFDPTKIDFRYFWTIDFGPSLGLTLIPDVDLAFMRWELALAKQDIDELARLAQTAATRLSTLLNPADESYGVVSLYHLTQAAQIWKSKLELPYKTEYYNGTENNPGVWQQLLDKITAQENHEAEVEAKAAAEFQFDARKAAIWEDIKKDIKRQTDGLPGNINEVGGDLANLVWGADGMITGTVRLTLGHSWGNLQNPFTGGQTKVEKKVGFDVDFKYNTRTGQTTMEEVEKDFGTIEANVGWFKASIHIGTLSFSLDGLNDLFQAYVGVLEDIERAIPSHQDVTDALQTAYEGVKIGVALVYPPAAVFFVVADSLSDGDSPGEITHDEALQIATTWVSGGYSAQVGAVLTVAKTFLPKESRESIDSFIEIADTMTNPAGIIEILQEQLTALKDIDFSAVSLPEELQTDFLNANPLSNPQTLFNVFKDKLKELAWESVKGYVEDYIPIEFSGNTFTVNISNPWVKELILKVNVTTNAGSGVDIAVDHWSVEAIYKVGVVDIFYTHYSRENTPSRLGLKYEGDTLYVGANIEFGQDGQKLSTEDVKVRAAIIIKDDGDELIKLTPYPDGTIPFEVTVTIPDDISEDWAGTTFVYTQMDHVDNVVLTIPEKEGVTKVTVTTPILTGFVSLTGLTATRAGDQWDLVPNIVDNLQLASQEQLLAVAREKFPELPELVLQNLSVDLVGNDVVRISFDPISAAIDTEYISGDVTLRGFEINLRNQSIQLDYSANLNPKLDVLLSAFDISLEEQLILKINSTEDINPNNVAGILDSVFEAALESMGLSAPTSFGLTTTASQSEPDKAAKAVAAEQWDSKHPKVQDVILAMYGVKRAFKNYGSIGLLYEDGSAKFYRGESLSVFIQVNSESVASEFGSATYQNLMKIAETLTGQQILRRLAETDESVVITWSPSFTEVDVAPSWTSGQPIPVTYNHLGSSIVGQDVGSNNNSVSGAFLPEIDLAHELIHAVHIAEEYQETLRLASPPNFDTDPGVVIILANMLLEESRTIGTGSYSPGKTGYDEMNENNFRRELWRNRGQTWYWHRVTHAEHVEKKQLLENGPLQLLDSQSLDSLQLPTPENLAAAVEALPAFPPEGGFRIESVASADDLSDWLQTITSLTQNPRPDEVVTIVLNLTSGEYSGQNVVVPKGYRLNLDGTYWGPTLVGQSPSLTLVTGDLLVFGNVTFTNATDAPTIVVQDGHLRLRNTTVKETTVADRPAINIIGGSVDLGTASEPGANTIVINGDGNLIDNKSPKPLFAIGNTFQQDGRPLTTNAEIEAKIEDAIEYGGSGIVTFIPDTVFRRIWEGPFEMNLTNLIADLDVSDPVFQILTVSGGTVTLLEDEKTVRFVAPDDGAGSFAYAVMSNGQEVASRFVEFHVMNVAPSVNLGADFSPSTAGPVIFQDKFTDPGTVDTHTFLWQVTSNNGQVITASTERDFSFTPTSNGQYIVTYTVTDNDGGTGSDEIVVTVNHFPPETVATLENVTFFNEDADSEASLSPDGTGQRSIIKGLQVVLDGEVEIPLGAVTDDAFRITALFDPTRQLQLQILEAKIESGKTFVTLGFDPQSPLVDHTGSLINGRYHFLINGTRLGIDADGSGSIGGNATTAFHRLFGDADGDADVDNLDYMSYRYALFSNTQSSLFDFDGDGQLTGPMGGDPDDLNAFFANYGRRL